MDEDMKFTMDDTFDLDEIKQLLGDEEPLAEASNPENEPEPEVQAEDVLAEQADAATEEAAQPEIPVQMQQETELTQEPQTEAKQKKEKASVFHELYDMLHDVIFLLAAVTLIFVFVVRLVGVQGESMLPTLHNGDFLLLESNFLYHGDRLEYGDVVVINVPYFKERGEGPIVKRVIATEGQTVDIDFDTGSVYVDGVLLQEDYIHEPTYYNWGGSDGMSYPAVVPEGCIFVMGDNRNNSMDSRFAPIGMIEEEYVLGKVLVIAMPGQTKDDAGNVTDARDWGRIGLVS